MEKRGRNELCWCGSGKKYKKCHLKQDIITVAPIMNPAEIQLLRDKHLAREELRKASQGKGRPIITDVFDNERYIAIGNMLIRSDAKNNQTFPDILNTYLKTILTPEWGNDELKKPMDERHPLLVWYHYMCIQQKRHVTKGTPSKTPGYGAMLAYTYLAYNLYLLQHDVELQEILIKRIKNKDQFHAAYYETHVVAWFIRAGFKVTLEDEQDPSTSHCEFIAEAPSGKLYSVEAKCRQEGKENVYAIRNQLYKALKKDTEHTRIICIEMNIPQDIIKDENTFINEMTRRIRELEQTIQFGASQDTPSAYLFITNLPHHLHLDDTSAKRALLADGFKIDDFGFKTFPTLTDMFKARQKHSEVYAVLDAIQSYQIPITFNGELAEFSFGNIPRELIIGESFQLGDQVGILRDGTVIENEKTAYLIFEVNGSSNVIYKCDLSDDEISAYKAHPETFFGTIKKVPKGCKDPIELYTFLYDTARRTEREVMLDWFKNAADYTEINKMTTEDMQYLYAERQTLAIIHSKKKMI